MSYSMHNMERGMRARGKGRRNDLVPRLFSLRYIIFSMRIHIAREKEITCSPHTCSGTPTTGNCGTSSVR